MTDAKTRGADREQALGRDAYFSDQYFSMRQLCTFAHQLNHIWTMKPTSAIEIGLGNGFVSSYLKRAGVPITTVDINPALVPDICAPLHQVRGQLDGMRDLVICCEVLEHMPLEELDANLDHLKSLGSRLFLTLPNSYRTFGFGGLINLPKLGGKVLDLNCSIPSRHPLPGGPHFWEVGHSRACSRAAIVERLQTRYSSVKSGRFELNPNHIYFICQ
jgi:hypothetical protein